MTAFDEAELARYGDTWRSDGWVVVPDLVPTDVIDAAVEQLWSVFAPPDAFDRDDDPRVQEFWARRDRDLRFVEPPAGLPAFRPDQLLGIRELPLPAPRANALAVDPRVLAFVRTAMATVDVQLYVAQVWAKYTGVVDYEQPLHRDHNHSLVPPGTDARWWPLEGFLYLTDVIDESDGPTRLVAVQHTHDAGRDPVVPAERPDLFEREVSATARRGSFLAYRTDVWHRATNLTRPGGARLVLALSYKPTAAGWVGYGTLGRNAPNYWFQRLVAGSTVDQLAALGFPRPGHPFWTRAAVDELGAMYPGLDTGPWVDACA